MLVCRGVVTVLFPELFCVALSLFLVPLCYTLTIVLKLKM